MVSYEGEYVYGRKIKQGRGILVIDNWGMIEGYFANDQPNGKGRIIYSDGRVYVGQLLKSARHG